MTPDADMLTDRRKLKRRLSLWRFVAVVVILGSAVGALIAVYGGAGGFSDHIARVRINGIILDDTEQQKLLKKIADASRVKAVILAINSPGGTTTGSEALYEAIRKLAKKKPVVAVLGTVAASGGYIAALGADYIVARGNTITGSIGVIFQWAEFSELFGKIGVKFETIKSGPLKAQPNFTEKASEAARKATEDMVRDSADWFYRLVTERRKFSSDQIGKVTDGRVFTGRQALEVKLIDAIGGEQTARKWLESSHGVSTSIDVIDWPDETLSEVGLGASVAQAILRSLGFGSAGVLAELTKKISRNKRLSLDGLVSVWQAER